uniref:Uncharacterized protein n=1 Tax=Timema monikensis TaxID=170555 RepID=A0A7R9E0F5_9NEOP|nr:unnamed protein product [Timema monikensis]
MEESEEIDQYIYVLDGGHTLHNIVWPRTAAYQEVINNYTSQVIVRYNSNGVVVFDGYPRYPTMEENEQEIRAAGRTSTDINISEKTVTITTQAEFLANNGNKKLLIKYIVTHLKSQGVHIEGSKADADLLQVQQLPIANIAHKFKSSSGWGLDELPDQIQDILYHTPLEAAPHYPLNRLGTYLGREILEKQRGGMNHLPHFTAPAPHNNDSATQQNTHPSKTMVRSELTEPTQARAATLEIAG